MKDIMKVVSNKDSNFIVTMLLYNQLYHIQSSYNKSLKKTLVGNT
jgi:hypothetical protein